MTSSVCCCCRHLRQRQRQQRHACRKTMLTTTTTTTTRAMLSSTVLLLGWMLVVGLFPPVAVAQSNYVSHANNVEYRGEGLPEEATLDGKVSARTVKLRLRRDDSLRWDSSKKGAFYIPYYTRCILCVFNECVRLAIHFPRGSLTVFHWPYILQIPSPGYTLSTHVDSKLSG